MHKSKKGCGSFVTPLIKACNLFPHLLNLGWPSVLLWIVGCNQGANIQFWVQYLRVLYTSGFEQAWDERDKAQSFPLSQLLAASHPASSQVVRSSSIRLQLIYLLNINTRPRPAEVRPAEINQAHPRSAERPCLTYRLASSKTHCFKSQSFVVVCYAAKTQWPKCFVSHYK
jgi:hypothetical protein